MDGQSDTSSPLNPTPQLLLQQLNLYLAGSDPYTLILFGAVIATLLFILFPRLSYGIASVGFLQIVLKYATSYHKDIQFKPVDTQLPHVATLILAVAVQLYCSGKTMNLF